MQKGPGANKSDNQQFSPQGDTKDHAPSISLPKGGGAIRGIGEKFAANPVTGTGSMSVPIAASPGRNGFGPQLTLSYDSGSGNGPFGFGWTLSLPSITRRTDKGLPRYNDAIDSDIFILSGAEDLVPIPRADGSSDPDDVTTVPEYAIRSYRPRIEGLFSRIERWTSWSDGDVHWRSMSKDNILTLYGKDTESRITSPEDPTHVFTWLICETRDDKGNAVEYKYKAENGDGVPFDKARERNRGGRNDSRRATNRYLKTIRYGNRRPLLDADGHRVRFQSDLPTPNWMFEVVFDYGEHSANNPTPNEEGQWPYRLDAFSTYRSGFEVRTTRLCQRVLMFHHFDDHLEVGSNCLVRSTDFTYSNTETDDRKHIYTFLQKATQTGYRRNAGDGYDRKNLPPVAFDYTQPNVQDIVEVVRAGSLENLPAGVDGANYQWADLHGEGIPGVLTEQAGAWFYKRNLTPRDFDPELDPQDGGSQVLLAPMELVRSKPNLSMGSGRAQIMDLAGDGQPDLVVLDGPNAGFYEHDSAEGWEPFRPFKARLNRDMSDPNLKLVDLDGDGHADVLITEDDCFAWHPSLGEAGFGPARRVAQSRDEEKGPRIVFADGTQSIYLADLSGDGLTDLVRIRNGEVCYWPNLGYCRFGAKVTMDNAPRFDNPDQFDHKRIRLADIDGSGTTDIIYLHRDGVRLYFNECGNRWSQAKRLNVFPIVDDLASIVATDLLGNGTACLVWSSPLPGDARRPMRYVNLMGGHKPHLLRRTINNLGAETLVHYAPSTKFYLQDKRDGKPWVTRLPFPVHVVERVETLDHISGNRFVTRYAYHHGYFDGEEREFRGFGMVEQFDTEAFAALGTRPEATNLSTASDVPTVLTKSWFHTGVHIGRERISWLFEKEYYPGTVGDPGLLDDTALPPELPIDGEREACRALKGSMLRQEVYALDGLGTAQHPNGHPYTVTEQNFAVRRVQPRGGNRHAVYFVHPLEALSINYERNPDDPCVQHAMTLEVDDFGNVLKSIAIGYGRSKPDPTLTDADQDSQELKHVTFTENEVTNSIDTNIDYRAPLPSASRTYELTGFALSTRTRFGLKDFTGTENDFAPLNALPIVLYHAPVQPGEKGKRLIEHVCTLYRKDDLTALLPVGKLEPLSLPGEMFKLAFTNELLQKIIRRNGAALLPFPADVLTGLSPDRGGYVNLDGDTAPRWCRRSKSVSSTDR